MTIRILAKAKRLQALAWSVADALRKPEVQFTDVPRIFRELVCSKADKSDIFEELDRYPGLYGSDTGWHSKLRSCRNHPIHGQELFEVWK
jgi:hypothetical protein